ncbi:hypothetical protein [Vibrio metoecus]|uniref:hypothetical protein n=1 Tax=Vibrio metoecus TaxID=1481663 RepID=UPI0001B99B03|nr:hypothetical protein [Vibrio metoecus]EEX66682.1 hypothetical protein VCJ_001091 [Vibrio metoecus]
MSKYSVFLVALLLSPASFALSTSFELPDDIQFTGSVVTPAPTWKWRIHSTASGWATNWTMKKSQGEAQSDGATRFVYDNADKEVLRNAFIQGIMTHPSSVGRSDIVPTVSLEVEGGSLVLNGNTVEQVPVVIPAIGRTRSGAMVHGKLSFTVESAYAVFYKKLSDPVKYYSESYINSVGWAANSILIENKPSNYDGLRAEHIRRNVDEDITAVLRGVSVPDAYDVMGGFTSHLSHFEGVWREIPHTWTATLTANVRIN